MRFARLDLIKYGRFDGCQLEFRTGKPDLHIIFGPNEAGKTTTMAAVSDLLFGFGNKTFYDFQHDKSLLRIGATIEHQKQRMVLRRKKGNKNTLLDEAERPVEESVLAAMLAGQTDATYQRMFSLNHHRLREGGKTILDAADNVGQALFAAGSGLVGLKRVLDALEGEADSIWAKRANRRSFHAVRNLYDTARDNLRNAIVKPAAWTEAKQCLDELESVLSSLRDQLVAANRDRSDVERVRRILVPCAQLRQSQEELHGMGNLPFLPDDAAQVLRESERIILLAEENIRQDEQNLADTSVKLNSISYNPLLLENQEEIRRLLTQKGEFAANQHDLPNRYRDLSYVEEQIAALQNEMGWPGWSIEQTTTRLPGKIRINELRFLLEELNGIEVAKTAATKQAADRRHDLSQLEEQLKALPRPVAAEPLALALKQVQAAGDSELRLTPARAETEKLAENVANALASLIPWQGSLTDLSFLPVPSEEFLSNAAEELRQAKRETEQAQDAYQRLRAEKERLTLFREQIVRDNQAVPPEQLQAARDRRATLWQTLRSSPDTLVSQAELFEAAMQRADELADRRFLAAESSAQLAQLNRNLEQKELELQQAKGALGQAQAREQASVHNWNEYLQSAGLPRLSLEALRDWLRRRETTLLSAQQWEVSKNEIAELERKIEEAKTILLFNGNDGDRALPLKFLIAAAERTYETSLKLAQEHTILNTKIAETQASLQRSEQELEAKLKDEQRWAERWTAAVSSSGLDVAASSIVIKARLNTAEEMRSQLEKMHDLHHRIESMEANNRTFSEQVNQLADKCSFACDGTTAERVDQLAGAVKNALQQAERKTGWEQQQKETQKRLQEWREKQRKAERMLRPLLLAANAANTAELGAAIHTQQTAEAKRKRIAELQTEILNNGDGRSLADLLVAAETAHPGELAEQSAELQNRITEITTQIETKSAEKATAAAHLATISGGNADAALAAAELEEARATMELEAEAYLRKRAQAVMLRLAIQKYQEERQGPLLKRASELFAVLTLGRYERLCADYDDSNTPHLLGQLTNGSTTPIQAMSEGTLDQVYLALRLAAMEEMVENGAQLPFLADDLFINFDDERAGAGLRVLQKLACRTQVLFFTHHRHLLEVAERELTPSPISVCRLTR